ncbi:MAG: tyrosine-type recombinase/integrase [Symploca sp. SIO3E6]|nr:tyrosine-type recombinase/integrase [Caldora sp. SIO3E6]
MKTSDCYNPDGSVRSGIVFRRSIRKGGEDSRVVPIADPLRDLLEEYKPSGEYMFPGQNLNKPVTRQALYKFFQKALEQANLKTKGLSLHGTRATGITKLHNAGYTLFTIREITGHRRIENLKYYIKSSDSTIKAALSVLE